jgi:hypothetical protein
VSMAPAPLTHRPTLSRIPCPICLVDTLHKLWKCIHCGNDSTPPKRVSKPAFGARLVLGRRRKG